ncbi:LysR family transcriptional regulator [Xanthobacteraceae bacterium Astr-EGSB]|uniref:LysR family transcriptional regulator n=1 Tax=Astrobacterium formosum TaxID=3069710 RepID=UPI0027B27751|nr:LysR family transcriptional regulator [Xanthobacteraceae bacterium Astr-EGSB]
MNTDHFDGISVFVHAADAGGFTQAARRLGMSKSGVAKSVVRLEERLGVRLFHRTTRRFALTLDGQVYYETCARVLSELDDAEATLSRHRLEPRGRLRVDLPLIFGRRWVLPVLLDIAARYPQLALDVSLTPRHSDLVEEGIDLALRFDDLEDNSTLIARHLGTQNSVFCASPDYIARHGCPASLADLDAHSCNVLTRSRQALPWWFLDDKGKPFARTVSGRLSFDNSDAVCEATVAGQGICLLARWLVADHLRSGRLRQIMPDVRTRGFPIHAIWPRGRHMPSKVRVVIDELVRRFLPNPPWNETDSG